MVLDELVAGVAGAEIRGAGDVEVTSVDYDSRAVRPGSLFCCLVGQHRDGHDFAEMARAAGATALVVEHPVPVDLPQVVVGDSRAAMGRAAAALAGEPCATLAVVGITGTNGKTTTAHLVGAIANHAGRPAEVIGTLTGRRTTPESPDLQRELAAMRDRGTDVVAMEVSSHALSLRRVVGCRFRVAVFTNLGRDHLDFHADIEDYYAAKRRLFTPELSDVALVNADDEWGRRLLREATVPVTPFSVDDLDRLQVGLASSTFSWRDQEVRLALGGRFNVANALAAAETGVALGLSVSDVAAGLAAAAPVPGRFEAVPGTEDDPVVLVDYAHTPDGLEQLLAAARELAAGRVLLVFGCGGDRDREKRPLMGRVAARGADKLFVTSDNPRSEDPMTIIAAIESGIAAEEPGIAAEEPGIAADVVVEPDRRAAIELALAAAGRDDVVILAGKGHETRQIVGDEAVPFDDREVAAELLDATRDRRP